MSYRDQFNEVQSNTYWTLPRVTLLLTIGLVVIYFLGFLATGGDLFIYRFWAPKQEAARRQVYEQTKSYRQGNTQRLNTLCTQVADADDAHKGLINDVIRQEFADWNTSDVPDYLQGCLSRARSR